MQCERKKIGFWLPMNKTQFIFLFTGLWVGSLCCGARADEVSGIFERGWNSEAQRFINTIWPGFCASKRQELRDLGAISRLRYSEVEDRRKVPVEDFWLLKIAGQSLPVPAVSYRTALLRRKTANGTVGSLSFFGSGANEVAVSFQMRRRLTPEYRQERADDEEAGFVRRMDQWAETVLNKTEFSTVTFSDYVELMNIGLSATPELIECNRLKWGVDWLFIRALETKLTLNAGGDYGFTIQKVYPYGSSGWAVLRTDDRSNSEWRFYVGVPGNEADLFVYSMKIPSGKTLLLSPYVSLEEDTRSTRQPPPWLTALQKLIARHELSDFTRVEQQLGLKPYQKSKSPDGILYQFK